MLFVLFYLAPTDVVFYALTQEGIVGYFDVDGSGGIDRYLVGRSSRPVAVTYDRVEQVRSFKQFGIHVRVLMCLTSYSP